MGSLLKCLRQSGKREGNWKMARRATYASEDGNIQKLVGNHDHASAVRAKIINSAKCLLAEEGYSKTTIRKIVDHSGILTGSIYYFFKNKEDIFHAILLELMRDCIRRINIRFKDESPLFIYAAVCQVELKALADNQIVRDSYKEGYDSVIIFEGMVAQFHEMARTLFNGTKYEKSDEEYYENTLMIKGAMHACLTEMSFHRPVSLARSRERLVRMVAEMFGTKKEAGEIVKKIREYGTIWEDIGAELVEKPISDVPAN